MGIVVRRRRCKGCWLKIVAKRMDFCPRPNIVVRCAMSWEKSSASRHPKKRVTNSTTRRVSNPFYLAVLKGVGTFYGGILGKVNNTASTLTWIHSRGHRDWTKRHEVDFGCRLGWEIDLWRFRGSGIKTEQDIVFRGNFFFSILFWPMCIFFHKFLGWLQLAITLPYIDAFNTYIVTCAWNIKPCTSRSIFILLPRNPFKNCFPSPIYVRNGPQVLLSNPVPPWIHWTKNWQP